MSSSTASQSRQFNSQRFQLSFIGLFALAVSFLAGLPVGIAIGQAKSSNELPNLRVGNQIMILADYPGENITLTCGDNDDVPEQYRSGSKGFLVVDRTRGIVRNIHPLGAIEVEIGIGPLRAKHGFANPQNVLLIPSSLDRTVTTDPTDELFR